MQSLPFAKDQLFRLVIDASPAGMLIADNEGTILLVNQQALRWLGYELEELIGRKVEELLPKSRQHEHRARRQEYMKHPTPRSMAGGKDLVAKKKDGSEILVDVSLHPIDTEIGTVILANMLESSVRRQAERDRDAKQAMEKLMALGQLAGGVAHEIRTPLCVIRNDIYYLRTLEHLLDQEAKDCIVEINDAVEKANRIVGELLDFTRDPPSHAGWVDWRTVLETSLRDYRIPEGIELVLPQDEPGIAFYADREQVERILVNLLRNAAQAMNDRGKIEIRIENHEEFIVIHVIDNGPGIPAETITRVFDPLFTTKPKGIGLGLAISQRYALRNGGDLSVSSRLGEGASFRLQLPKHLPKVEDGLSRWQQKTS